jgi:outer membrane protein OmpU
MNKLTKIGVSALAGALVSFSANAADWNMSGSAGFELQKTTENGQATWYQYDSINVTSSGTTDSGIDVNIKYEIDDNNADATYDDKYITFGTAGMGTVGFHGRGGSSVMGAFDDITPKAYEEVWDIGSGADTRINGRGGGSLFTYDSPSFMGLTLKAAYQSTENTSSTVVTTFTASGSSTATTARAVHAGLDHSDYMDWGVTYKPEMVDGLTLYYAQAELEAASDGSNTVDQDMMGFTYAYGPVTIGYQENEADAQTSTDSDESESMSITYAVTDDLTISYGEREYDFDTTQDGDTSGTQKDSGFAISYTMGGASVAIQQNDHDNVGGTKATDQESYLFAVNFAF